MLKRLVVFAHATYPRAAMCPGGPEVKKDDKKQIDLLKDLSNVHFMGNQFDQAREKLEAILAVEKANEAPLNIVDEPRRAGDDL